MHCHYIAVSLSHGVKLYHRKSQKANRCTQPPKRVPSWHFPPFLLAGTGLCSLFTFRAASMRDFGTAPFRAAALSVWGRARTSLSAWFESTVSHHMAHGLDNPQGRTCNLPCQEKALESLPRCSFPDRMCANQQPRRRTGAVFICRLSAVWSAARVCRHGWFDSKGGFCIPVAQVMEQRSPKPQAAGLIPAGNACVPYEGNSGASGRESSGCSSAHRLTHVQRTECMGAAYMPS